MAYVVSVLNHSGKEQIAAQSSVKTGAAQLLAYLASAPLIAAALIIISTDADGVYAASYAMTLYGAALIVFFGGVRWGVAIMKDGGPTMRALLGAGLPLVLALPLLAPSGGLYWKFLVIMALVALLLIDDLRATRRGSGAPEWYLAVRLPLTVLIELAFLIAIVGVMR
ncbi:DUF3429 domain-containing protein [Hyphococcus flavus]|uniref:DUF3429 domain-containing protein n=1 Tax=Hyphococcus flavus TaxID=1866326 RepID=A0AAE9ZDR9_9PROT|nr:DUF3429 domain-containing protein [Hyphococcus flavus]WDI30798.1 DUF3429 domain-containing protein [Hyphococcus flavus]